MDPGRTIGLLLMLALLFGRGRARRTDRPGQWFAWSEVYADPADGTAKSDDYARALASVVLDPLRDAIGAPLVVTSWHRTPAANQAAGGVSNSHHLSGGAVDLRPPPGWTAAELAATVVDLGAPFDELIVYSPARGGHLHIAWEQRFGPPEGRMRYAPPSGGLVPWAPPGVVA